MGAVLKGRTTGIRHAILGQNLGYKNNTNNNKPTKVRHVHNNVW